LFGNWAACRENAPAMAEGEEAQVALLFDQLIAIVEAIDHLRTGNTTAISCVVCGGTRIRKEEEPPGQA